MYPTTPRGKNDDGQDKDSGEGPRCKYCETSKLVRWGKRNGHQRYQCKDCNHTFDNNGLPPRMRTERRIIAAALELYFGGASLPTTSRLLWKIFRVKVSFRSILNWIQKYVPLIEEYASHLSPSVEGVWHADETLLRFRPSEPLTEAERDARIRRKGEDWWFWDAIDEETRFVVGCHLSHTRRDEDAVTFFKKCHRNSGKPIHLVTDGLGAYNAGRRKGLRIHPKRHTAEAGLQGKLNQQLIERFHGTLEDRIDGMRGLVSPTSVIPNGIVLHYNYLRPHTSLGGMTPAKAAGIHLPFEDGWGDMIRWATAFRAKCGYDQRDGSIEADLVPE